ncbi:MAG: hypothetical protein WCJ01_04500 [Ignavibacteria bacterium]
MKLKIKILAIIFVLAMSALVSSCKIKEIPQPMPVISADSVFVLKKLELKKNVKKILGDSVLFVEAGNFKKESSPGVVAGIEVSTPKIWGIRFAYLDNKEGGLTRSFETKLLKGSLKGGITRKFKLSDSTAEMIYYDSQDYFLGSGGGEVFSYIVDFVQNKVYSAHFFTVPRKPVSLFLSPNIDNNEIRNMFIKHFQKDYPDLRVVSRDYNLEDIF